MLKSLELAWSEALELMGHCTCCDSINVTLDNVYTQQIFAPHMPDCLQHLIQQ